MTPLTTTVMGAVAERHAGVASGINNAVSRCAGLLAVAVLGLLMLGVFGRSLEGRMARSGLPAEARRSLLAQRGRLAALPFPDDLDARQREVARSAVDRAFLDGFRSVMAAAAALALLAAASAAWMIRGPVRR